MIGILKTTLKNIDKDTTAINSLNKLIDTSTNACLFCDSIDDDVPCKVKTNILHRTHTSYFKGIIITDDLIRGQDLINTTYAKKRFLYLYHLEWHKISPLKFSNLAKIFLNDNIELIAQNEQDAKIIEGLFKKPKYIMKEWDYQILIRVDQNE